MRKQKQKPTEKFTAKTPGVLKVNEKDARLVMAHMSVAFLALDSCKCLFVQDFLSFQHHLGIIKF